MPGWDDLYGRLVSFGGDAEALAALLELDRQRRPVSSAVTRPYQHTHGGNVSAAFEAETRAAVAAAATSATDADDLNDAVYGALNDPRPSFLRPGNAANEDPAPPARLLRYVSIRAVLEYHLLRPTTLGYRMSRLPKVGPDRGREARGWLEDLLADRAGPGSFDPQPLSGGSAVWVTDTVNPPHEGRSADEVARLMALPAFVSGAKASKKARCEEIGLVALQYPRSLALYKPTIAEGFGLPCPFYPGRRGEPHGTSLPLRNDFAISTDRSRPGAREWVHGPQKAVVRHRDADASECRVIWYDVFDCVRP